MASEARDSPRTASGRFVRAVLADPRPRSDPGEAVRSALTQLEDDEDPAPEAVIALAFYLSVRRRYSANSDIREITTYVADLCRRSLPGQTVDLRRAEAQIRVFLGEEYLVSELRPDYLAESHGDFMLELIRDLGLSDAGLDALIAEAERLAMRMHEAVPSDISGIVGSPPVPSDESAVGSNPSRAGSQSTVAARAPRRLSVPRRRRWRSRRPTTTVALWLRAFALDDKTTRNKLGEVLKESDAWYNPVSADILEAAFATTAKLAFRSDEDVRVVADWVRRVREQYRMPQSHMIFEGATRSALGEALQPYDAAPSAVMTCQIIGFVCLAQALQLSAEDLDVLLLEAERVTDRGR